MMKENFKKIIIIAGAFLSYTASAGFASGNEILQFFASWGPGGALLAIAAGFLITAFYCMALFKAGRRYGLSKSGDYYMKYGGPVLGRFFRAFVFVNIFLVFLMNFTGAGALLNQQFHLPNLVGALILGFVSAVVVLGGFKRVEQILGYAGIVILLYILVFACISLFNPDFHLVGTDEMNEAVQNGAVLQADFFRFFPQNEELALHLNGPAVDGILYGTCCLMSLFPFLISLGGDLKNNKEANAAGIVTAGAFYFCIFSEVLVLLLNYSGIFNTSGTMTDFPVLSIIDGLWKGGSFTYVLIIFTAIFTTVAGFLWVLKDFFFPGEEATFRTRSFILVMIAAGVALSGTMDFSVIINILLPISGFIGLLLFCCILWTEIRLKVAKTSNGEEISVGA